MEKQEGPFLLAIDDLEGRVIGALDDVKVHSGVRSDSSQGAPNVHEELQTLLRPVLEVAAHTGPSIARTYYRGVGSEGIEASVEGNDAWFCLIKCPALKLMRSHPLRSPCLVLCRGPSTCRKNLRILLIEGAVTRSVTRVARHLRKVS